MSQRRIRVLIADDSALFRDTLGVVLEQDYGFEVLSGAADGQKAVEAIRAVEPDVALVDLRMPGLDGAAVAAEVSRSGLATRVVILTMNDRALADVTRRPKGAAGYYVKDSPLDGLAALIRRVAGEEEPPTRPAGP